MMVTKILRVLRIALLVMAFASVAQAAGKTFKIHVGTGAEDEAGTDANVYVAFYGPNNALAPGQQPADTDWHELDARGDQFERGNNDAFYVTVEDPGWPIEHVFIKHDNAGKHPGWKLNWVKFCHGDYCAWDGPEMVTFYFNRWLSNDEYDRQLQAEVDLTPSVSAAMRQSVEEVIRASVFEVNPGDRVDFTYSLRESNEESALQAKYTESGTSASIHVGSTILTPATNTRIDANAAWYQRMNEYTRSTFKASVTAADTDTRHFEVPAAGNDPGAYQQGKYIVHTMFREKQDGTVKRGSMSLPLIYVKHGRHDFQVFSWGGKDVPNDSRHFPTRDQARTAAEALCKKMWTPCKFPG